MLNGMAGRWPERGSGSGEGVRERLFEQASRRGGWVLRGWFEGVDWIGLIWWGVGWSWSWLSSVWIERNFERFSGGGGGRHW